MLLQCAGEHTFYSKRSKHLYLLVGPTALGLFMEDARLLAVEQGVKCVYDNTRPGQHRTGSSKETLFYYWFVSNSYTFFTMN